MADADPDAEGLTDRPPSSKAAKPTPVEKPATKKPATKKPATKKPATKKPATKKPATKTAKKPTAKHATGRDEEPVPEVLVVPPDADATADLDTTDLDTTDLDTTDLDDEAHERSRIARARAFAQSLKERGEEEYEHLQDRRADSRAIDSVFVAAEHDTEVGGGILAGAVAFRLFLFMVPFVFVLVVAFGIGTGLAGEDTRTAASSAGAIGLLAKSFASVAGRSTWDRIVGLFVGGFALLLTSRSALKVLRVSSALTWRVPVPKLQRPSRAAGLFIVVIAGAAALIQLIGWLRDRSLLFGFIATLLFVLVPAGLWLFFSLRAFPHPEEVGWKALVPGSLLVGVGLEALHLITIYFISRQVESKSETYGAIGVALAMLFWAYLMGRILIAGNVLNAALWYRDHPRPGRWFGETDDG